MSILLNLHIEWQKLFVERKKFLAWMYLREWEVYPKVWRLMSTQPASMNYMNYILGTEGSGNILSFLHKLRCLNVSTMTEDFSNCLPDLFLCILCFLIKTDLWDRSSIGLGVGSSEFLDVDLSLANSEVQQFFAMGPWYIYLQNKEFIIDDL